MTEDEVKTIKDIIHKELHNALYRDIKVIKSPRPGEDPPEEGKEVFEKKSVNVLEWFTTYLPYVEGALRGMQGQLAKLDNNLTPQVKSTSKILIQCEKDIKEISKLATKLKPVLEIGYESDPKRRLDNKVKP
ncbi:MAG: hypothetical protein KAQ85_07610 [Thermodesulfovibrionia bacterium]|nr:hypothetical protein [Thermodesulfovibrionia bacterium]